MPLPRRDPNVTFGIPPSPLLGRQPRAARIGALALTCVVGSLVYVPVAHAGTLRCNGSAALCARSLGDVAFATAHNAMASSADGFVPPNQGHTIAQQLRDGIRGFQIDVYPGSRRDGRVYTDLEGSLDKRAADLPARYVTLATRLHRSLGAPAAGTPTDVYLCHTFCELGATKMADVAHDLRTFLDGHPHDVLVAVIEDYVSPERTRDVLRAAGLERTLVPVPADARLPTLGDMIRDDHRLLVMLENGDGGSTMPNAFAGLVQETPFTFLQASALRQSQSCVPNRGGTTGPIFQFNHWVTPAEHLTAQRVNSSVLRERLGRCAAARGRGPTLVAVDFAERGDLFRVVRELNR